MPDWKTFIIDASWVGTRCVPVPYLHRDLLLEPGDIYLYDSFTAEAFRGRGLYPEKVVWILHRCRDEGFVRSFALIAVENRMPHRLVKRVAADYLGTYHCARLGPWQWIWQEPAPGATMPPLVPPASSRREHAG